MVNGFKNSVMERIYDFIEPPAMTTGPHELK